ncbi:MAG: T9SS C-terminal target domain-containing protein [Bacteroidetes bacterium]|nr:MAG: T9SS C-terminal target domain-containing protein [Bacteroidota bacterium]
MKNLKIFLPVFFISLFSNLCISQSENCLEFDGIDDYVYVGDVNNLGTSDFTLEAWIFLFDIEDSENGNKIVTKGLTGVGTPGNAGYALRASRFAADEVEFQIGHSDGSNIKVQYYGISTHTWYHVVGVRSGKNLFLYLDGELVASDSSEVVYNVDTNIPLVIGAIHKLGIIPTDEYMNGKIDEVRIWDRALSESEIKENMNCALSGPIPNLLGVYNLNSETGTMAIDSSGFDNHGSLENGPIWSTSPVAQECVSSIEEILPSLISVYPNPFESEIYFDEDLNGLQFRVFDVVGKLIRKGEITNNKLVLENLVSGSYLLEIFEKEKSYQNIVIKI